MPTGLSPVQSLPAAPAGPVGPSGPGGRAAGGTASSFAQQLAQALDGVNQLQLEAQQAAASLLQGGVGDVAQVVIASEKASLALQLVATVRNEALAAYQDVMRTPL
ncbi:MAG: flagellar hook-basal body complex protein FliE [Clostridia bacterium]|nr:flagellar hook-basal body complex protein FliE [Clostridia bacterium]MCL6520953.1 flagellar hook-basal body complex protein FliE [Bacillota bacterium]